MSRHWMNVAIGLVLGGVCLCAAVANAQIGSAASMTIMQNGANAKDQKDAGSGSDKNFVKKTLQGGLAEIDSSKLALKKSSSADVKKFAQQMVDDHGKLGDEMKPVATQIGVGIPTEPAKKDKAMIARLGSLSGNDFDKAYVQYMLKDHEMDAAAFKAEATAGKIVVVKDAAAKNEPVIDGHLQMIQGIAKSMNVSE